VAHGTPAKLTAAALATAIVLCAGVARGAAPPRPGSPAPAFSLPLVANGQGAVSLASLHGHAVYLNFFASWCQPCKTEVPYISRLAREYAKRNVVVIGIDELEPAARAQAFAREYHLTYPIALDNSGTVGGDYGLVGLPLHVFIAANGTVAQYRPGELSEDQVRAALNAIAGPAR
jgi:cytochrome c biogenesis protein CcmG/thiol:disulfide interchange protein DsbE